MAAQERSRVQAFWPSVIDLEAAKSASRYGYWAAVYCASVTAFLVLLAAFGIDFLGLGFDVTSLVDVAVLAAIAWGINRYSRTAALLGLTLYVLQRVSTWTEFGGRGGFMTLLLSLCFVHGIRGTFAYHRHRLAQMIPVSK